MSAVNKVGRVGSLLERVLRGMKVQESGCWEWQKCLSSGYGCTSLKGVEIKAHRASYELFVGKIPKGLEIDHLCRNRKCINPAHLEPVTKLENVLRGISFSAVNARKTHCIRGHKFPAPYQHGKGRICLICKPEYMRRYHERTARNAKCV